MPSDSEELIAGWFHAVRAERRKVAKRAEDAGRYDKLIAAIEAQAEADRREEVREARRADQWAARYAWARENGWDD